MDIIIEDAYNNRSWNPNSCGEEYFNISNNRNPEYLSQTTRETQTADKSLEKVVKVIN